ncbi:MAG: YraN family protein [Candidatus Omnitrophica bacterium]|jgi:putative endonuclease|nr:YraN family protein [Candidatus Omnitrophota bacterium]
MSGHNVKLGKESEQEAVKYLKKHGYKIIQENYRCSFGQIDIIAQCKGTICFVEVKSRTSTDFGTASEAVTQDKQRRLTKTAVYFLKEKDLLDKSARFDVVCIDKEGGKNVIDVITDAFEMDGRFSY